jgi:hypothetical protein
MLAKPWTQVAGGVTLDVRLTPRGARDAIEGIDAALMGMQSSRLEYALRHSRARPMRRCDGLSRALSQSRRDRSKSRRAPLRASNDYTSSATHARWTRHWTGSRREIHERAYH